MTIEKNLKLHQTQTLPARSSAKSQRSKEVQEKILNLQQEQEVLEQRMTQDLFSFLKSNQAFSYSLDSLLGGFMEVLETLSTDPQKTENWRQKGAKLRSKKKSSKIQRNLDPLSKKPNPAQSTV